MSHHTDHRAARSKATARADQLRPLNLPQPVAVELDDAGLPKAIADHLCLPLHGIETILETWHVDDEWWREPISRRYVEVILEGGKHVVLYEDLTTNDWFMQMP